MLGFFAHYRSNSASLLIASALLLLPGVTHAQSFHDINLKELSNYGPYSGKFLSGGRGLEKPLSATDPILAADSPWTMSLWFHPDHSTPTTLIAGFGDPEAEDSRYLGLKDGKPLLRIGVANEIIAETAITGDKWHLLAATFDGVKAHVFQDGKEVASGTPAMGPVQSAELMIAPDFISNQEETFRWDQPHLPPTVPARLKMWQHFGGKIARFSIGHTASTANEIMQMADERPNFDTILYEDGSKPWPFQVRQQVGYVAPQAAEGLPQDKAPFGTPVAKLLPHAGPTLEQTSTGEWTIARNWKLKAAPEVKLTEEQVSSLGVETNAWLAATVPGTVLTTFVDRGIYPDPYWDLNNLAIPESLNKQDYWYRVEFPTPGKIVEGKHYTLNLNGINYAADVWLNGHQLGIITGAFIRGNYDVTAFLKPSGDNVIAIRISPPPHSGIPQEQSLKGGPGENGGTMLLDGPTFVASEGWDWIPAIRDRNSGIWQDVTLKQTDAIELGDPQIITKLPLPQTDSADVTINVPLESLSTKPEKMTLQASLEGGVSLSKEITLAPGKSSVSLTPQEFKQLHIEHPRLWWPNGYGKQELYHLKLSLVSGKGTGDEKTTQFGIREVTYELSLFDTDGSLRRVEVDPTVAHLLDQKVQT